MSFSTFHMSLGHDAFSRHVLSMQLDLLTAVRQALAVTGHPQADTIYQRLWSQVNESVTEAHADYILGRGPLARTTFHVAQMMNPEMSAEEIREKFIAEKLPKYTKREGEGDRSVNRHWATMLRVGLGADDKNRWNRDVLDQWFEEGKIADFHEFASKPENVNSPGAVLLRLNVGPEQHVYLVRISTSEYNRNILTVTETESAIEAAVLVPMEGLWATHDDGGLLSDEEMERLVTELLTQYGINEEPLPVLHLDDNEAVLEEASPEIKQLAEDLANVQKEVSATTELAERQKLAAEEGVSLEPAPETPEDVARLQTEAQQRADGSVEI